MIFLAVSLNASEYDSKETKIQFSWTSSDITCAYTESATRIKLFAENISSDPHSLTLCAYGWGLVPNTKYYGYYPYNSDYHTKALPMTALPISYKGQTQQGNASIGHIAAFDFMTSQTTSTSDACHFNFNHLGSIVRIECPVNVNAKISSITISAGDEVFTTAATMNVTNNEVTATEKSTTFSLTLNDVELTEGNVLVAYMMMAPVNLQNVPVDITLTTNDGKTAQQTFTGPDMKPGKLYSVVMNAEFESEENDDDPNGDDVLARKNIVSIEQNEDKLAAASAVIEYPTASATDFELDTESSFEEYVLLGDANSDGVVNTTDAVLVINYYLGKTTEIDKKAADISLDGVINTTDAVGIINKYLNK